MEVLIFSLLVLAPALGAKLPLQNQDGGLTPHQLSTQKINDAHFSTSDSTLRNTVEQNKSIFGGSDTSVSVDSFINNLSLQDLKPESNLPSNTLVFEEESRIDAASNIPSASALEEGLELNSGIFPLSIKSADEVVCAAGEVLQILDGTCVTPIIRRNIFTFAEPIRPPTTTLPPVLPPPVINYDIVFIKSPEPQHAEPIIIPPPQHQTLVYLLSKKSPVGPNIIEVPSGHHTNPEVYYVNYNGATGQVDSGRHNSDILLPTGDHLSNLLNSDFLQSDRSTAATQTPVQDSFSTSSFNAVNNEPILNTNFVHQVGSTTATQNSVQGTLPISVDIGTNNQNNVTPVNNSNLPTFELIDNSSINNLGLPRFEMVQSFGTASNDEILRRFGLDKPNINLLRRSLNL